MLRNYLKIAYRNLKRRKGYTFINVGGLGLGLACCFLIMLFVRHELSFDRFHEKAERIYRILPADEQGPAASTPSATGPDVAAVFPGVEAFVRVRPYGSPYLKVDGRSRRVSDYFKADPSFFEVFDFPLLRGNPETALIDPHSLVLTESSARALFGSENPMGKTVTYGDDIELTVTGVMADVPANSHLQFSYLGSFNMLPELRGEGALHNYTDLNYHTYLLLQQGTDAAALERQMSELVAERYEGYSVRLQPLTNIHFATDIRFDAAITRSIRYLYVFSAVALLILLIACVNFTNLATARATQRAKEVGVRKAVGAQRRQVVFQFLGESVLLSLLALGLAFVLVMLLMPTFGTVIGAEVNLGGSLDVIVLFIGIGLAAGLLAGSYPAFYLSAFRPARVLKGDQAQQRSGRWLQKALIVFQFAAAIVLLVGTFTVYDQLHFMRSQDLGFEEEHVLFFQAPASVESGYDAFKQELLQNPQIQSVALSTPPGRVGTNRGYNWPGATREEDEGDDFWTIIAGSGYLETMGIDLKAGRAFASMADTQDVYILNETAVQMLEWEDPVGHSFRAWDRPMGRVIGVVEDFHFQSLHSQIEPVVINFKPGWVSTVAVRVAPGALPGALDYIQSVWDRFSPGYAFNYTFLDEDFGRAYAAEEALIQRFGFFAAGAILIACLGLFGLAAYAAERRTKEIGVRKVLGASTPGLMALLSKDFLMLVGIAFVIAAPLAYYAMNRWLQDFAYRIDIGVGVFALAGVLAVLIALATVSYQALRAALADPVEALRSE